MGMRTQAGWQAGRQAGDAYEPGPAVVNATTDHTLHLGALVNLPQ